MCSCVNIATQVSQFLTRQSQVSVWDINSSVGHRSLHKASGLWPPTDWLFCSMSHFVIEALTLQTVTIKLDFCVDSGHIESGWVSVGCQACWVGFLHLHSHTCSETWAFVRFWACQVRFSHLTVSLHFCGVLNTLSQDFPLAQWAVYTLNHFPIKYFLICFHI